MKRFFLPVLVLLAANIAVFWQFYFKHLLPFPGDLLVSFFFPWNSGGFAGFDQWTTHKDVIAADVIRQMYPWKSLVIDQIKAGQWPLWNPYNFSGSPLLANLQSSVFFPGNILLLILPFLWGWISLVIGLPFLYSVFSYLFLRSLKLSQAAAIFGAVVAANISYFLVWSEQLVIIQSALFLPLALWAINENKLLLVSPFLAFSIFGGHIQTAVYVYIITFAFAIYKRIPIKKLAIVLVLSLGLAAVQLLPSAELYLNSAREGINTQKIFTAGILPWKNLITIFAPDFFGNPATKNFVGSDYGNFQVYFGVVALVCALLARKSKFFLVLGLSGLLFATTPMANLFTIIHIPILSSGVAARSIFIFQFCFAILAAFGFDRVLQGKKIFDKKILLFLFILPLVYFNKHLALPVVTFLATIFIIYLGKYRVILLVLAVFEYVYFFNKYQPFSPQKFVFPDHPVTKFLQSVSPDRFYGVDTAYIDNNFATYYKFSSTEGYDSLYIKRYGELLASSLDGQFHDQVPRSDAVFTSQNSSYRDRLFDLLGTRFILDKNDQPKSNWEPETWKFSEDKYVLFWQSYKWKAYLQKTFLPRAFVADSYEVISQPDKIIDRFYAADFDYRHKLILETDPHVAFSNQASVSAEIISYQPNRIVIKTNSPSPKLLFLSDVYFPGWQAKVNGASVEIFRADYIFRAVVVPAGQNTVEFIYYPKSFQYGMLISGLSLLVWICLRKYYHI